MRAADKTRRAGRTKDDVDELIDRPCRVEEILNNPPVTGSGGVAVRRVFAGEPLQTVEEIDHDPTTVVDRLWRPIAEEQFYRRRSGLALTHRLMQLPAVSRRAERLVGPMRGLLIDG
jgi:hypothetical protein